MALTGDLTADIRQLDGYPHGTELAVDRTALAPIPEQQPEAIRRVDRPRLAVDTAGQ